VALLCIDQPLQSASQSRGFFLQYRIHSKFIS